jgi:hypothetical protein
MTQNYNFLVGHLKKNDLVPLSQVSELLRQWFDQLGVEIERYGSKTGRVVKFSEKSYEKTLAPGGDGIELFSPRTHPKDECDETMNGDVSAVFSYRNGLMLSVNATFMDEQRLIVSFWETAGLPELFEYVYAYQETHAYGTGFALGHYTPDAEHPFVWPGRSKVDNWADVRRKATDDRYIRDVFDFNAFSQEKLESLPPHKRDALETVMKQLGELKASAGFYRWTVAGPDQTAARAELVKSDLLAAYVS